MSALGSLGGLDDLTDGPNDLNSRSFCTLIGWDLARGAKLGQLAKSLKLDELADAILAGQQA